MIETKEKIEQVGMTNGNREVVSDTFSMLMEYPEYALDVYNALNGSHYQDPSLVQIVTLRHAIYYFDFLKRWVKENDVDLYGRRRVMIPSPHFVVFYNGAEERPDIEEMRLSTSFQPLEEEDEKDLEVICKVYNVNLERNSWLSENSRIIREYGIFVDKIRNHRKAKMELGEAIDRAIDDCIREDVLRGFFVKRRDEVRKAMQLDFTWERREQLIRKEEFREGKAEGKAEDIVEMLEDLGEVPTEIRNEIYAERDLEVLRRMHKLAKNAESVEDFVKSAF